MNKPNSEDQDFLAAIQADPDDDMARLVYADWLDEQGKPGGEYFRLQVEIKQSSDKKRCEDLQARLKQLITQERSKLQSLFFFLRNVDYRQQCAALEFSEDLRIVTGSVETLIGLSDQEREALHDIPNLREIRVITRDDTEPPVGIAEEDLHRLYELIRSLNIRQVDVPIEGSETNQPSLHLSHVSTDQFDRYYHPLHLATTRQVQMNILCENEDDLHRWGASNSRMGEIRQSAIRMVDSIILKMLHTEVNENGLWIVSMMNDIQKPLNIELHLINRTPSLADVQKFVDANTTWMRLVERIKVHGLEISALEHPGTKGSIERLHSQAWPKLERIS